MALHSFEDKTLFVDVIVEKKYKYNDYLLQTF